MVLRSIFLVAFLIAVTLQSRNTRSVAPFLGSGGSRTRGMLVPRELWHCGSEGFSLNISYSTVSKNCPSSMAAINHCCAIHDDCYGQQKGQEACDQEMCDCYNMVVRLPTEESFKCRGFVFDTCLTVSFIGGIAYGGSNYSDPAYPSGNILISPKTVPSIEKEYMDLYSSCPHVNITMASCAFNFDLCALVHSVDFCANDLCHCIMDAGELDTLHSRQCLKSVAHTCRLALKHSSEVLASRSVTRNFIIVSLIIALIVVAGASLGFGVYFIYIRQTAVRNDRRKGEEGKYLQIHTVESSRSVNPLLSAD